MNSNLDMCIVFLSFLFSVFICRLVYHMSSARESVESDAYPINVFDSQILSKQSLNIVYVHFYIYY